MNYSEKQNKLLYKTARLKEDYKDIPKGTECTIVDFWKASSNHALVEFDRKYHSHTCGVLTLRLDLLEII